ncbi:MAG TPA: hypothetical protein VK157_17015, partial [Phycisphaerales bacterium]|nr:hypothetical protein [Phycisphaerales bacterium]
VLVDLRGRRALIDDATVATAWPQLDFVCMPTAASDRYELRIDLSVINATVGSICEVTFEGADSFTAPVEHVLSQASPRPPARPLSRPACPTLRVVSLNTLVSGLIVTARRPALLRLIDAVDADVYCFQEEYNSTGAQIITAMNDADPRENGLPWNVIKTGELVIASQRTLVPVTFGPRYQGAVVLAEPNVPGSRDTLVINNHMSCCGYAGDASDQARITQATDAISVFNQFRAGTLTPPLQPYANVPAIVVGDWNHVGSTTPLDLWQAVTGPALTREVTRHLTRADAWTWRSGDGLGFWPGELDLVAFDASRMTLRGSFVLDTSQLDAAALLAAGLLATDSDASDHLLVVTDVAEGTCCDDIDFNNNTVFPEDADVIDFFNVLAGGECSPGNTCNDIDFNNNTVFPEDQDVIDYFTVLAGGTCP